MNRVLIVEDDDALASALESFVAPRSTIVQRAATKARALEILNGVDVDVGISRQLLQRILRQRE